jgi:hypothetical protein
VQIVFGVDGGNSKTDLVTASLDGEVVAPVRGTGNNLHFAGVDATPEFLGQLAAQESNLPSVGLPRLTGFEDQGTPGVRLRNG